MGGYRIRSPGHPHSAQLDWWKDREAKNGNVKGYGFVWPKACGSFAGLAVGESIFPRHRLGISELPQKGQATLRWQNVGRGLSPAHCT